MANDPILVTRVTAGAGSLADPDQDAWGGVPVRDIALVPTPLAGNPAIRRISPFLAKSTDHGSITRLTVACAHDGEAIAIRLGWPGACHDRIADLDQFVDGAAVMFPLTPAASAFTMGSDSDPVNAWYWKANRADAAFDVVARGYGTSERTQDAHFPVAARARHDGGHWHVVLVRAMRAAPGRVAFAPGAGTRMAFAVWDGGNRERAGRKSFSGDFVAAVVAP